VSNCLFCRIVAKEIPATVVYETDSTLAFRDVGPKAPVHVLVIPKEHHANVGDLAAADPALAGAVLAAAGQEVEHVHVHVLGGAPLGPMLSR